MTLTLQQGRLLVLMARDAIDWAVEGKEPVDFSKEGFLRVNRGVFVTLNKSDGELRGCIGIPYPVKPLGEAIVDAAVGAATRDPRFPRVNAGEADSLTMEVSALTEPTEIVAKPLDLPKHVEIGTDGLIVSWMGASGLLLPQVATEMRLSPQAFLSLTCEKAGLFPDAWRNPEVKVSKFQAEIFTEKSPRGLVERRGR